MTRNASSPLRVVLAGFSGLGTQDHQRDMYLPAFTAHPGFQVVGVSAAGESSPVAARMADQLDVPFFEDLKSSLVALKPDVVSVCVSLARRTATVVEALRAGAHVLADKPMAPSPHDAALIASVAAQAGRVCFPAHHQRFHASVLSARTALAAGRIGLPWNVQADFLVSGGDPVPEGELLNLALYPVDVVQSLIAQPVRRVHAIGGSHWSSDGPTTDGAGRTEPPEDLVVLALDHAHGVTSTIVVGRRSTPDGRPGPTLHRYRISGSHGLMLVDTEKPAAVIENGLGVRRTWAGTDTVSALVSSFHAAVNAGRAAELSPQAAVVTTQVEHAARHSLRTGCPVDLPDVDDERGPSPAAAAGKQEVSA